MNYYATTDNDVTISTNFSKVVAAIFERFPGSRLVGAKGKHPNMPWSAVSVFLNKEGNVSAFLWEA
jgi:hypothetical protein